MYGDIDMSAYETQIAVTAKFYDRQMRVAEAEQVEILNSVVADFGIIAAFGLW